MRVLDAEGRPVRGLRKEDFVLRFYPFLPEKCRPLLGVLPAEVRTIWALLPLQAGGPAGATGAGKTEVQLDVRLHRADEGEEMPVEWSLIDMTHAADGTEFIVAGIRLPDLGPGAYQIEFEAADAVSGAKATASAGFNLK